MERGHGCTNFSANTGGGKRIDCEERVLRAHHKTLFPRSNLAAESDVGVRDTRQGCMLAQQSSKQRACSLGVRYALLGVSVVRV